MDEWPVLNAGIRRRELGVLGLGLLASGCGSGAEPPPPLGPNELDDASGFNRTTVASKVILPEAQSEPKIEALRRILAEAKAAGRPVSVGAARHSMGGQAIPRDGVAITFDQPLIAVDAAAQIARISAGARWHEVIAALDPLGFSPKVMQSNSDFGVAGTLSVNAHGWPAPFGPFGSTVRRFRIMLADGTVLTCAPDENADLFQLVIGGYGLFGIVLDMDLEIVRNELLVPHSSLMPSAEFGQRLAAVADQPGDMRMVYGRLDLTSSTFMEEALLVTWHPAQPQPADVPAASSGGFGSWAGAKLFRYQENSEFWRRIRWALERRLDPSTSTRNSLLNEPAANHADGDFSRRDILHEYFVPLDRFADFVAVCRKVILASRQQLLNVTLRLLEPDRISRLAYAPERRVAAVMLFAQERTALAEEDMRRMTVELIQGIIAIGGSYYLPYRLHARSDQLVAAYPRLPEFLAGKRYYDPDLRFRNLMWDQYFAGLA